MLKPHHVLEKRQFGRRTSFASAWVGLTSGTRVPCSVLNISEGGALIGFSEDVALPPRFTLTFNSGLQLDCELRHRRPLRAGVEFVIAELQDEAGLSSARAGAELNPVRRPSEPSRAAVTPLRPLGR